MLHHTAFVTAARLDANACCAGTGEVGGELTPARQRIGDLPTFGAAMERNVELEFGRIDSSRRRDSLRHLRRPCLVKRTRLFRQPSGSDEGADDDHATGQPGGGSGRIDPIASGLPRRAVRGRPFLSEQADNNPSRYYKGGARPYCWRRLSSSRAPYCVLLNRAACALS